VESKVSTQASTQQKRQRVRMRQLNWLGRKSDTEGDRGICGCNKGYGIGDVGARAVDRRNDH
jgi:hypothetical protein